MQQNTKRFIFWTPRILGILFTIFTSLFALDVFENNYGFWDTFLALIMHLIPTMIVALIVIIAWKWELVGAILFISLALFYIIWTWGRFPLITYIFMSGPLLLTGLLFLVGWKYRFEIHNQ